MNKTGKSGAGQKSPVAERSQGRPADLKSGELQQRLLDSAEYLFAKQGFAATPVRQLAEHAKVTPALVHYYFGTKQELLIAVLDRALLPIAAAIQDMKESGTASLESFVVLFFNMAGLHPSMPRLITREVMLSSGETKEIFIRNYAPKIGGALPGILKQEQKLGRLNADFDPGAASLMLISLCMFPFVARSIAEPQLGISYSAKGLKRYLEQIKLLLSNGMLS